MAKLRQRKLNTFSQRRMLLASGPDEFERGFRYELDK